MSVVGEGNDRILLRKNDVMYTHTCNVYTYIFELQECMYVSIVDVHIHVSVIRA